MHARSTLSRGWTSELFFIKHGLGNCRVGSGKMVPARNDFGVKMVATFWWRHHFTKHAQTKSDHGFAGPRWSPVTCAILTREMLGVQELDGGECGAFVRF